MAKSKSISGRFWRKVHFWGILGVWKKKHDFSVFRVKYAFFSETSHRPHRWKMAIGPLKHPKNALAPNENLLLVIIYQGKLLEISKTRWWRWLWTYDGGLTVNVEACVLNTAYSSVTWMLLLWKWKGYSNAAPIEGWLMTPPGDIHTSNRNKVTLQEGRCRSGGRSVGRSLSRIWFRFSSYCTGSILHHLSLFLERMKTYKSHARGRANKLNTKRNPDSYVQDAAQAHCRLRSSLKHEPAFLHSLFEALWRHVYVSTTRDKSLRGARTSRFCNKQNQMPCEINNEETPCKG